MSGWIERGGWEIIEEDVMEVVDEVQMRLCCEG